jgi:hypothetical protein
VPNHATLQVTDLANVSANDHDHPQNIMQDSKGRFILVDWGLSKIYARPDGTLLPAGGRSCDPYDMSARDFDESGCGTAEYSMAATCFYHEDCMPSATCFVISFLDLCHAAGQCSTQPNNSSWPLAVSYRVFKGKSNTPRDDLEVTAASPALHPLDSTRARVNADQSRHSDGGTGSPEHGPGHD